MSLGEATALGAADGNHDDDGAEGRDDLGYVHGVGDVLEILNDEERVAFERDDQQFYTLQQLQEMPNAPTARMIIANNCYLIAVICKFVALRLHNSHGCPHPRIFSAETREFIQKESVVNIGIGEDMHFVNEDITDEEVNPLEEGDDLDE